MPLLDSPTRRRVVGFAFSTLVVVAAIHALSAVVVSVITGLVTIGGVQLSEKVGGLLHLLNEFKSATLSVGLATLGIMAGAFLLRAYESAEDPVVPPE